MKKTTIKDIAKEAGVSVSTVSFVMNGKGKKMGISEAVILKVQKVVSELGYKPNVNASSLRTGKTQSIVFLVEDISNPFFSSFARVIEEEASKYDYRVFYFSTNNNDESTKVLLKRLVQENADGFVITPTENLQDEIDMLLHDKRPVVLIDRFFEGQNVSHVIIDNYDGAFQATKVLIDKGCKKIALVTTLHGMVQMELRKSGYIDALKQHSVFDPNLILITDFLEKEEDRVNDIVTLLQKDKEIDGILFLSNYLGFAGLLAMRKLGLQIPKDVSVICFDDVDSFRIHSPAISVVAQPIDEMGKKVVDLLMAQIKTPESYQVEKLFVKGKYIERESV
ncbi:LacI family transcriptional regulator [Flavobacterium sp. LM5]|uniref:LacI family DNA-binding transcriptional regulator n=1 Tax=Flavobacterium sp. LM5 TaxID=1938610 RepID=UPI00099386E1|nr:LacI family DNA-binding transcriptional regulator [Flavobacterium sp. LM5]OOV29485.1 LacI family transcriptional regulator [Flavobacterium sp. LM5]